MAKIFVFGVTPFAEMLRYYVDDAGQDEVAGYVVDEDYLPQNRFLGGLAVISWDYFMKNYPPESCKLLSSVTYNGMNKKREALFHRIKDAGYSLATFVHPSAIIASNCQIGEGNIFLEHVTVQPFTTIGDNNVFWSNVNICHHSQIGSFNFFAASCCVLGKTVIKNRCFIGSNATIKNRTIVESDSLIGACAFSSKDTVSGSVIVPALSIELEKKSSEICL